ncbi:MAG: GGDEF domain-containing protein, partial [Acutalibacteraceae bacterium]|nr:GGDEF domain-containing protein [Acutalibacteraceae bacterium]
MHDDNRGNWFRDFADRFHRRAMDLTLLLFRGRAGIVFTVIEVLYFCFVFYLMYEQDVTTVQIFFLLLLNIGLVGLFICLLSRAVFSTLQQEVRLTEAAIEETIQRSQLDPLTGLYNRATLFRELGSRIRYAEEHGTPLSLILFDLDNFKDVNDAHGHAVGDECLVALSEMLRDRVRGQELAARYGGEEFVLVLPGTRLEGAVARAEVSRQRCAEKEFSDGGKPFRVTASAGVAEWEPGMDTAALIDLADQRMYTAKEAGRDLTDAGPEFAASKMHAPQDDAQPLPRPEI